MSPPNGVAKTGADNSSAPKFSNPSDERKALLVPENFLVDSSNEKDPLHFVKQWNSDRDFRLNHNKVNDIIETLGKFIKRDSSVSPQKLDKMLSDWKADPSFDKDPVNAVVYGNIRRVMRQFQTADNAEQAGKVDKMLPPEPPPVVAPAKDEKKAATAGGNPPPEGWSFNAISGSMHFLDDKLRILPSYYTAGIIPKEGFGQNQSSDFGFTLNTEFSYKDFGFFAGFYYNDAKPLSALTYATPTLGDPEYSANFGQAGVRLGMVEYGGPMFAGTPGKGFYGGLMGRREVGLSFGAGWCSSVAHPELGGKCKGTNFQLGAIDNSDILGIGYGPAYFGVRLLPSTAYINSSDNGLPLTNRLPLEFSLAYHINSPYIADKAQVKDDVLLANSTVTNAQVTLDGISLFTGWIRNNIARKTEAAYQSQRLISLGQGQAGDAQYSLLNTGTFLGGLITGFGEGSEAYRAQRELRYGNTGQRAVLGSLLGVELLTDIIGFAATPGLPSEADYKAGKTEGITNLQARAFRTTLPMVATRDGLIVLGAVGAFGDLNKSLQGDSFHSWYYPTIHGVLGVGGLVLALTSGNFTGNGFFGNSILGNQPPNAKSIEIVGSPYDYPAQNLQYYRLQAGGAALSYGLSGLLEWGLDKVSYTSLPKDRPVDKTDGAAKKPDPSKPPVSVNVSTDGRSNFNIGVSGQF